MLYVAIGSLWVVSIICMLFLAAYIYQLTRRQLDATSNSYVWTVLRTLIVFCLGLSVFYFGVANRVESLPKLDAYRLQIRQVPLWSAQAWVSLSLAFVVCAVLFALTDTLKNDLRVRPGSQMRLRRLNIPRLRLSIPYGIALADPQGDTSSIDHTSARYFSQADQFWALANVLVGLFTGCFLFVGLQTVSQVNFVQALGIQSELNPSVAFNERVRPSPAPTLANLFGVEPSSDEAPGNTNSAAGVAQAPLEVAARSGLNSASQAVEPSVEQPLASTRQPSSAPSSNQLSASSPVSTSDSDNAPVDVAPLDASDNAVAASPATELSAAAASPQSVVLISEPLGVNARTGPGTTFGVITVLQNGTRHTLLNRSNDGQWLNIELPGATTGWVASWVVDISP